MIKVFTNHLLGTVNVRNQIYWQFTQSFTRSFQLKKFNLVVTLQENSGDDEIW